MKILMIGCETIKEELLYITDEMKIDTVDYEWIDGGLHGTPEKLQQEIQLRINKYDGQYQNILLGYGYCGGGTDGLQAKKSRLILPKMSDCISMLLGSEDARREVNCEDRPFYFTKGWARCMDQVEDIRITRTKEKYGLEKTRWIYQKMFAGYDNIDIIDTGAYSLQDAFMREKIDELNEFLDLPERTIAADLTMLIALLSKDWNSQFLIKEPGETIRQKDFDFHISLNSTRRNERVGKYETTHQEALGI